ncbi:MAG: serine hydrolase [Gammaproteobacteria bacterium]|nr:serine hydrolase [Gammaproteobacteria bacterium]
MQEALNDCRNNNADHEKTEPCRIVNLDGYWGAQLLSGLPGLKPYTATEITEILAGNSIVHSSNRTGFKRFFNKNGQHIFDPDRGFYLTGHWYVRETDNKLCDWEVDSKKPRCAAIQIEENLVTLDYDGGLPYVTKLVPGNATDPIDNPGLNFDPSRELALSELQDVVIQPPEETLATELATFSGAWYGTWYAGRDFAIIIEQINRQTASLIYAWGPNKMNSRSQAGLIKTTAQIDSAKLKFKLWGDSGVLTLSPDGNLSIDWTSDDWSGRSIASRWPDPPWDAPITQKLETPDLTKPLLGWLTTLRMAQKYGVEIMQYKVSDFVELKTENRHWNDVAFEHLLSMVSGIGDFEPTRVSHYVETLGTSSDVAMARAATSKERLTVVERTGFYPWGPGEVFRYARFDPFILALALSELHRSKEGTDADLWEMMNHEVFRPIGIANLPIRQTQTDEQGYSVPFFSNGAFVTLEDVAKIEALIRADGSFGGQQILPAELLNETFDGTVEKSGYPTGWINNTGEESRYFRYFWYGLYTSTTGCKVRAPLMSGWGGNAVLIMPNGITALRFASGPDEDNDNDTWDQKPLGRVADGIRPLCVASE